MSTMAPFLKFLNIVNVGYAADTVSPLFKLSLLFIVAAWIAATVVAVAYSAYGFSAGDFSTVLPLKFLRATARLTVVMFVPFASVLVSANSRKSMVVICDTAPSKHALTY